MMRWTPEPATESTEAEEPSSVQYLLDAVVVTLARLNSRSFYLMFLLALIVLTVLFGLSTQDSLAGGRWCPVKC
ncbi:MAG TPA: hypothetical protein VFQ80_03290 [Thermomicrobiales bacterium]|jgi:hypothetical protein|nr:hypothetical protein [Thermomicrobiales bacterium]